MARSGIRPPPFNEMIVYQCHIGTLSRRNGNRLSTYLDVVEKTEYLADLGANVIQPLPVTEFEATTGLGYDNCDYYSPEMGYQVSDETQLKQYLATINRLLAQKGRGPLHVDAIRGGDAQLKLMVDLLDLYGMAVVFDVVYNHGGGFGGFAGIPEDREAIFFWDRQKGGDNNRSLYFTDQTYSGGLGFALFKQPVSDFLIRNALYLIFEFHIDGLRYDEISQLLNLNAQTGADFWEGVNAFLHHNVDRVIAFQRWVDGVGDDVVVVASLNEFTFHGYVVGFPGKGIWREVFNSDVYDNWVNPVAEGNGGQICANDPGAQGLRFSASIVIPANGLLVFVRES